MIRPCPHLSRPLHSPSSSLGAPSHSLVLTGPTLNVASSERPFLATPFIILYIAPCLFISLHLSQFISLFAGLLAFSLLEYRLQEGKDHA